MKRPRGRQARTPRGPARLARQALGSLGFGRVGLGRLRLKRWPEWTLRTRMVMTVVGLAGVALLVTNIVGVTMLRSYLSERLDSEVRRLAQVAHSRVLNNG